MPNIDQNRLRVSSQAATREICRSLNAIGVASDRRTPTHTVRTNINGATTNPIVDPLCSATATATIPSVRQSSPMANRIKFTKVRRNSSRPIRR